jgi:uncharacterized glyoxalase superfamily protein PhnB
VRYPETHEGEPPSHRAGPSEPGDEEDDVVSDPSKAALRGAAPVLVVEDVVRAVEHYRDALGFHTTFLYGEPTFYAGVERDGVLIFLQAARETKRQPGHGAIYIFVRDVDVLYAELKAHGARIQKEPKDYAYGMRDFDVEDLDGNHLCFGMDAKSQPQ